MDTYYKQKGAFMDPFYNYDSWKLASQYDNEVFSCEECGKICKEEELFTTGSGLLENWICAACLEKDNKNE